MCTYRNASLGRIRVESNDPEALMDLGVVVFFNFGKRQKMTAVT